MSMLFTLVVWVIFTIMLIIAVIIYVLFLWRHIPRSDGRLSRYCRRKVDARLDQIVNQTIRKALSKENAKSREELKKGPNKMDNKLREPTLPRLSKFGVGGYEPSVHSIETQSTLPPYLSRTGTGFSSIKSEGSTNTPPVPSMEHYPRPGILTRTATNSSDTSNVSSKAPLLHQAADMGYLDNPRPFSPDSSYEAGPPSSHAQDYVWPRAPPFSNTPLATAQQPRPASPFGQSYKGRSASPAGSQDRSASPSNFGHAYSGSGRASPAPSARHTPFGLANRAYTQSPLNADAYGRASPAAGGMRAAPRAAPNRADPYNAHTTYAMEPLKSRSYQPSQTSHQQYAAYNPAAMSTGPPESYTLSQTQQRAGRISPNQHSNSNNIGSLSSSPPPLSPVEPDMNFPFRNNHQKKNNLAPEPYGSAYGPTSEQTDRRSSIGDLLDSYGQRR